MIAEAGGTVRSQPRQDLMPALQAGCLGSGALRGTRFPQPMVTTTDGAVRLDDLIGCGWRLVLASGDGPAALFPRLSKLGVRTVILSRDVQEQDGVLADWFARNNVVAALVRPDHYFGTVPDHAGLPGLVDELEAALA